MSGTNRSSKEWGFTASRFWGLVHRYAGLFMTFLLIVAGLTGSILAFDGEINGWLNPPQQVEAQGRSMLAPSTAASCHGRRFQTTSGRSRGRTSFPSSSRASPAGIASF